MQKNKPLIQPVKITSLKENQEEAKKQKEREEKKKGK